MASNGKKYPFRWLGDSPSPCKRRNCAFVNTPDGVAFPTFYGRFFLHRRAGVKEKNPVHFIVFTLFIVVKKVGNTRTQPGNLYVNILTQKNKRKAADTKFVHPPPAFILRDILVFTRERYQESYQHFALQSVSQSSLSVPTCIPQTVPFSPPTAQHIPWKAVLPWEFSAHLMHQRRL